MIKLTNSKKFNFNEIISLLTEIYIFINNTHLKFHLRILYLMSTLWINATEHRFVKSIQIKHLLVIKFNNK